MQFFAKAGKGGLFGEGKTILNGLRLRSGHLQRKNYFKFRVCRALRSATNAIFTGGVVAENSICSAAFCESAALRLASSPSQSSPVGLASSPKGRALGMAVQFAAEVQSLRACLLPLGGAVAQRLRGYGWRSEKSVKAIAPTGAALAFLCFDFFFRFVKGVQPLTRCGVGGVQR